MQGSRLRPSALALAALLASACGPAQPQEGAGTGIVREIGADRRTVTLEHGEIPGLMQAMTMEFALAEPAQLAGVELGESVHFRLVYEAGAYTITELREAKP